MKVITGTSIQIIQKDTLPNQKEWFEITLEPDNINPNKMYNIRIIFRSSDRTKYESYGETMIENINKIIDFIES